MLKTRLPKLGQRARREPYFCSSATVLFINCDNRKKIFKATYASTYLVIVHLVGKGQRATTLPTSLAWVDHHLDYIDTLPVRGEDRGRGT